MSLFDNLIRWLHTTFDLAVSGDVRIVLSWCLVFASGLIIIRGLYIIYKNAIAQGHKPSKVSSWPPDFQFQSMMGFYLSVLGASIPASLLIFDTPGDFLIAIVSIFVAIGTILVVVISWNAAGQSRVATEKTLEQIQIDRRINHIELQIEQLYSIMRQIA
jgi:hypothetical protein